MQAGRKRGVQWGLGVLALGILVAILVVPRVRLAGADLAVLLALWLAGLGRPLEPYWALLSVVLMLVPAVMWGMAQPAARPGAPADPAAPADPHAPPPLSPRARRNLGIGAAVLFVVLQAIMITNVAVRQTLESQRQNTGPEVEETAQQFLKDAYYGNAEAVYPIMSRDFRTAMPEKELAGYLGDWRKSFQQIEEMKPLGYFYGLSASGPYTGIDYRYRGTGGEGVVRLHLVRESGDWRVNLFTYAVRQSAGANPPAAAAPSGPASPAAPAGR